MREAVTIWVDADACPRVIRDILCRAADRRRVQVNFVANHAVPVTPSRYVRSVQVPGGFDIADQHIAEQVRAGDLVVTSDIPLAAEVIERGAQVVTVRGEAYTPENIRQRLVMRDFMDTMRASGETGGGPPPLSQRDRQAFANALDRYLARSA